MAAIVEDVNVGHGLALLDVARELLSDAEISSGQFLFLRSDQLSKCSAATWLACCVRLD
jgi:hypothetical protein